MAEVVGIVLGAVALLSTFKDCIELFSNISAAKSLGSDYELLNTKLDIEKTLLLQWSERVRLVQPSGYDNRLDDPAVNRAVSGILAAVQRLLSESSSLQHRYGLKPVDTRTEITPPMSGPRMNQFLQDFESLNIRIKETQMNASVKRQLCWVVRDKEKFTVLVRELSTLVAKLNEVMPVTHFSFSINDMTKKDLESIRNLRQLQLVLEAARDYENVVADMAEKDVRARCQERVLERLWYRRIEDRRNSIAEAHTKTLDWVLYPPSSDVAWDDLSEWLRRGADVYWVSGKAGSGKSTLMKYCYQHPQTRKYLTEWAGARRLIMAEFFFWHLGTPEQKTFEGLSRGLLYSILSCEPGLIERVLPNMWRDAHSADKAVLDIPSESEMSTAFSAISHATTTERFCFFVDGLDEYSGNYMKGIDFLDSLVSSGNVKVLVSSRPIPPCYQAFSAKKKLQLQDLTREDIKTYIDDTVGTHSHTRHLRTVDPDGVERILQDVVNKASGVFLWVVLACRSLLEGFAAFDYLDELQRRVDELPPELESLFMHMLGRIEPRYQRQAAKLLRICYQRRMYPEPEPHFSSRPGGSSFESVFEGVYTLGLALVCETDLDSTVIPSCQELPLHERRMKCTVLEARLRSRCCGLLEVRQSTSAGQLDRCFCGHGIAEGSKPDNLVDSTVQFLHRSVFEFLSSPGVWDLDCLRIDDADFEANAVLSKMNLYLLCISVADAEAAKRYEQINELARECLLCVKQSDAAFGEATPRTLLDVSLALSEIIDKLAEMKLLTVGKSYEAPCPFFRQIKKRHRPTKVTGVQLTLPLAIELGMVNTVTHWGSMGLFSQISYPWPLLYYAISRPLTCRLPSFGLDLSPECLSLLLRKGCDPNQEFEDDSRRQTTPWRWWVSDIQFSTDTQSIPAVGEITLHFLKAGADLDAVKGEPLESIVRRRILSGLHVGGLVRDQRVRTSLCDSILNLIELRRAASNNIAPASGASSRVSKNCLETSVVTPVAKLETQIEGKKGLKRRASFDLENEDEARTPRIRVKSQHETGIYPPSPKEEPHDLETEVRKDHC